MNIAQAVILNHVIAPARKAGSPGAGNLRALSTPVFGNAKTQITNPFSLLFGKIHQWFTRFSETALGKRIVQWLKKLNSFLQAPKKEPPKPAPPTPSTPPTPSAPPMPAPPTRPSQPPETGPAKPVGEPTTASTPTQEPVAPVHEAPPEPSPSAMVLPQPIITTYEELLSKSKALLRAQKGVDYDRLSLPALSEKHLTFQEIEKQLIHQEVRLWNEKARLKALKFDHRETLKAASSRYKRLNKQLTEQPESGNALRPGVEALMRRELQDQKSRIIALKKVVAVLDRNLTSYETAYQNMEQQLHKLTLEIERIKPWIEVKTMLQELQPLPSTLH
ncbi:hypothetical protein [Vampirovibrio sp.]|uniref:hypothetical protein n=1 Tax=Vampirovibrio sp. TaxID=2717857 RepID=UPI0035946274